MTDNTVKENFRKWNTHGEITHRETRHIFHVMSLGEAPGLESLMEVSATRTCTRLAVPFILDYEFVQAAIIFT